ncbi:hypothetical protein psyc5s11_52250 [Clostridium gelidum]|uniref:Uncharacterized protein n=1 Tax=Clostridium gelidum TaxID=704125 RepID=A0ABM7TBP1_9CLOT|nr:hypothetical protein psyc5s11_52250 [Clostridium gelidum]
MYNLFEKNTNKVIKAISELFITKTNTIHNNVDELHKLDIFLKATDILKNVNMSYNIINVRGLLIKQ